MADKAPEKPAEAAVEPAPDPDEDDLDDLDDVLDEFAATKLDAKPPAPAVSGPARPGAVPELAVADEDEFAQQLQAGMADLLGELETSPELQKQFEDLVKDLGGAAASDASGSAPGASTSGDKTAATKAAEESFQETIRKTMERMQESGDQASAAAASADSDDIFAQMLKEMEKGGFGGEGNDDDFSKMLMGMMEQLTNKDILYEPMKELHDKFPDWMAKNKEKTPKENLDRYEEQHRLVTEIVARFEKNGYSDSNAPDREYIVERMQKMQAAGSPPPDLVGDMNAAQEALGEIDAGCPQQ
ncbi:Pex19-domain-containing protein [Mytilinidion resinicola]|uniref:Pex19-domain-containing protein n=1 Tax=Mytilinidion resinicola TaxID=574789 RepID=A0A6A6YLI7_9PEZI|nr:Pex19-domain-containing protein [Mytilinidion resinicola]KAF2809670.1 Pex19-domain-containing protein [Mytilinidion resinicola]